MSKKIVIAGGGFAGLDLAKRLTAQKLPETKITLIDKNDYNLYYPNLYEVASSEEDFTTIEEMKDSVAIRFKDVLPDVELARGVVTAIDAEKKFVTVSGHDLNFDYLVLALGSEVDYFGITGLAEHALTMKSVPDALRIRNQMEFLVEAHRLDVAKKLLRVVIGGGGFTGVELAGELVNLVNILSWKYNYPREKIELLVVEGTNQLLPGMPIEISQTINARLRSLGVQIRLNNMITNVSAGQASLNTGEILNYDLMIWTGGVKSAAMPFVQKINCDRKGRAMCMPDLAVDGCHDIYAIGDNACIMDPNQKPLAQTATQALFQSEYLAAALVARIKGKEVKPFVTRENPFIIPVKGKWAVLHLPTGQTFYGFFPWVARRFADFRYFAKIMPLVKAFKLAWMETRLYIRND